MVLIPDRSNAINVQPPTNSLERALLLLELVARRSDGLTNAEISRLLKIPRSTCSYILSGLESHGFLRREQDNGIYEIGMKFVELASGVVQNASLRRLLESGMQAFVKETRLSAAVGVLSRDRVLIVARISGPAPLRKLIGVGRTMPPGATAMGKILLAPLSPAKLSMLIQAHGISYDGSESDYARELHKVRKNGYATVNYAGSQSIAAPLTNARGTVFAAVAATGSKSMATWRRPDDLVELLKKTARELSVSIRRFPDGQSALTLLAGRATTLGKTTKD